MEARIEQLAPMKVAFIRHVGPYAEVGAAWQRLFAWAGPRGLVGPGVRMVGVCHDDPKVTPPDKVHYDACLVCTGDVQPEGELGVQELGGGDYAVATHRGPYEKLNETYAALGRWIASQDRTPAARPTLEFYRNNPMTTAPADLLTEVYVPLS